MGTREGRRSRRTVQTRVVSAVAVFLLADASIQHADGSVSEVGTVEFVNDLFAFVAG
ncbi:MAG: hypothetical protein ACI9C1_002985 [Candidatus Aldehydirespiratoraceae bacterium]|jgi:hypothetical protein